MPFDFVIGKRTGPATSTKKPYTRKSLRCDVVCWLRYSQRMIESAATGLQDFRRASMSGVAESFR